MQTTATAVRLTFDEKNKPELSLTLNMNRADATSKIHKLKEVVDNGKKLSVDIKPHHNRRSLDANSYLWVICQKIAEVLLTTKEEVYRKLVHDVGQFEIVPIRESATKEFIRKWSGHGLGWHAQIESESTLADYNRIICYFGSSVYNTKEMSVLIDEAVTQAKELDIETLPPDEVEALKALWEGNNANS
jgi:hypothetical protein